MTATANRPGTRRRWGRRLAWAALATVAAVALGLAWLLGTGGGRDAALDWLKASLGDEALSWESAEGTLGGTLELKGVDWQGDGVAVSASRLRLSPQPGALLGGALRLGAVEADDVHVRLAAAPDEAPEPWTPWPELLPRLPLPVDILVASVKVSGLRVTRDDAPVFALTSLDAKDLALVQDGLRLGHLQARGEWGEARLQGHYLPAEDFRTSLAGRLRLVAPEDGQDAQLQLSVRGDAGSMLAEASGRAGGPLGLKASLEAGLATPRWTLDADAAQIDPHWFGAEPGSAPLDASASLVGDGESFRGRLTAAQGDTPLALEDLQARFAGAGIIIDQGRLLTPLGELAVQGRWDPLAEEAMALTATADDLTWSPADGGAPVRASGTLSLAGLPEAWQASLVATLERAGEQADLRAQAQGDTKGLALDELSLRTPGGQLIGTGRVDFRPELAIKLNADLDKVDPGYLAPDYPGAISGSLRVDLRQADAGWVGTLALADLSGTLRGRAVAGQASLDWRGDAGKLLAAVRVGESRLDAKGRVGRTMALDVSLNPLRLADLVDGAGGQVQGTLRVQGALPTPGVEADLTATSLRWNELELEAASLRGTLPANSGQGSLVLDGTGLRYGDRRLESLTVRADGYHGDMDLRLQARSGGLNVALAGTALHDRQGRRGQLRDLLIDAPRVPALALREPAAWSLKDGVFKLEPACVAGDGGGFLCLQADRDLVRAEGEAIPLALAKPWLPDTGVPVEIEGLLSLEAELRQGPRGWNGELRLASEAGALGTLAREDTRILFAYRDLQAQASLVDGAITASAGARLNEQGRLSAELQAAPGETGELSGELTLDMQDLTWLELVSPDVVQPSGSLRGELRFSGTRAEPRLEGTLALRDLATELPALGLALEGGSFDLRADADGSAELSGRVPSGEGVLLVNGTLDLSREQPIEIALTGDRVTLSDTPDLKLVASPALVVGLGTERLRIAGRVGVPHARVDLEALDGGAIKPSPDVVLVDAKQVEDEGPVLDLAVHVELGDDVRLEGFGLDGAISGALDLRQMPGREPVASGTLQATGRYEAYGQELEIKRARLAYSRSPVDNPRLDILAERDRGDVTVGVQVRGNAKQPLIEIVSDPVMDNTEALSWLIFGRALQSANASESSQLNASALALGVGGNLLAEQLGEGLGLDTAGVEDSRALGGATFTLGKYLSPRLFVGYGISLLGRGQVVTLKYMLDHGFNITIESGTESSASLNWRTER